VDGLCICPGNEPTSANGTCPKGEEYPVHHTKGKLLALLVTFCLLKGCNSHSKC
jgi:hypothetical protein